MTFDIVKCHPRVGGDPGFFVETRGLDSHFRRNDRKKDSISRVKSLSVKKKGSRLHENPYRGVEESLASKGIFFFPIFNSVRKNEIL